MERTRGRSLLLTGSLLILLMAAPVQAYSIFGDEVETFLKEKVAFGGFIENTTGLAIGPDGDRRHFNTSNRFVMNRLTIQPEFNVDFHQSAKFFISWRFVKEPRYNMEARSRRRSVSPAAAAQPLESTFYDEDSLKPWEAVLDLKPTDLLHLRLGRQFISWGETDGIRILDVINPQDTTFSPPFAPNLFSLDETRIPTWGVRAFYTVQPVTNSIMEFFALPGFEEAKQRVDDVLGSNDTADARVRYGRWSSHPETRMPFGCLFRAPVGGTCAPIVTRQHPDAGDNWKLGTRITHNFGALNLGLGYIWGFNPQGADQVFKFRSPGAGPVVNLRLINDRASLFAGQFNYTVAQIAGIPFNTAIRGELLFYPDKLYNVSEFPGRSCTTGALTGFKAGPSCKYRNQIVEKHTIRYALGFDRSVLIPFLQEDPWRAFGLSFQLIQSIIPDHEDGIRVFSTADKLDKVTTTLTFRVSTGYLGDTILPDIFLAYDPAGYWAANPAVSYVPPWNEKIKLTLTAVVLGGHNKFSSIGLFSEKDSIFLKMRYQF